MFNLYTELNSYVPFDVVEAESRRASISFLNAGQNCFSRTNEKGHFTAGGLVVDGKGGVLLNHHKKSGMWFQFGGHCDGDIDVLRSALRELREESGITKCHLLLPGIFDVNVVKIADCPQKGEPEHVHYDINFLFVVKSKKFKISKESTEIKWVSISEAQKLISPTDVGMVRMLKKYERLLGDKTV